MQASHNATAIPLVVSEDVLTSIGNLKICKPPPNEGGYILFVVRGHSYNEAW